MSSDEFIFPFWHTSFANISVCSLVACICWNIFRVMNNELSFHQLVDCGICCLGLYVLWVSSYYSIWVPSISPCFVWSDVSGHCPYLPSEFITVVWHLHYPLRFISVNFPHIRRVISSGQNLMNFPSPFSALSFYSHWFITDSMFLSGKPISRNLVAFIGAVFRLMSNE